LKFQQLNNSKFKLGTKIRGAKLRISLDNRKEFGLFLTAFQFTGLIPSAFAFTKA
jgi:hypothetical protein